MTTTGDTATAEPTKDATVNSAGDAPAAEAAASPKKEPAPPKPSVHKQDFEKDVVYLYQFPRAPTIPSLSAYCLKVETFLRVTGIKYENIDAKLFKFRSKKGQLLFIELNGEEIADSDIILKELSKKFEKNLDDGLTTEQKVQSHAFESMLNNHTGWVVRLWRYSHPDDFLAASQLDVKKALNSKLPKGVLEFMFKWGIKRNVSDAIGHGIGHHSLEEAVEFGKSDLLTLSQFLGSKDYFFGKQIHQLDVVAFAHLSQFIYVPFEGFKEWIEKETPNLISFVDRVKNKYWSDWDEITKSLELNTHLPKKELTPEQIEEQKKAEEKKAEEARKKEEKKKEKEEKKKQKEEEKRKAKEEKERKKKEAEEAKAKAAAEKAEKEKAEKEKKEAEAKAAAEAAGAAAAEGAKTEEATKEEKKE